MSPTGPSLPQHFDSLSTKLALIYGLLVLALLGIVLGRLHGGFSYSLDDPYIHLALAQQIAHGHYGINAGEAASPSSSIVWPLLLVPFSWAPFRFAVPLLWNIGFGLAQCVVLGRLIDRSRILGAAPGSIVRWLAAAAAIVCVNLLGLTFLGMEHVLQVLLVTGCAWAMLESYEGRPVPRAALWMAAIAPSVRYENLAFTLAVALACCAQRRWRAGVWIFLGSLVPLGLFSLFLHHQGLPLLPSSVMVKGGVAGAHAEGALVGLLKTGWGNLKAIHDAQMRTLTPGIAVLSAGLWMERRSPVHFRVLLCAAAAIVLLYLFGPYGWFYRYDVAFRFFLLFMCLLILRERRFGWVISGVLVLGWVSFNLRPLVQTPDACIGIYRQQYQMHRFENEFWRGNVGVNDLGWVSVDHPKDAYILDLIGLASPEAARQTNKDPAWLRDEARKHHVDLVMIYPRWFGHVPVEWIDVGALEETPLRHGYLGSREVELYATSPASVGLLRSKLEAFANTLPPGVWFREGPEPAPVR